MIVVFKAIRNLNTRYLEGVISILSIQPDNFTEIRFCKDHMDINSRTSLDAYLRYDYTDWGIKDIIGLRNEDGGISEFNLYILQEELLKKFKVLDQPKAKTINESLGILGN